MEDSAKEDIWYYSQLDGLTPPDIRGEKAAETEVKIAIDNVANDTKECSDTTTMFGGIFLKGTITFDSISNAIQNEIQRYLQNQKRCDGVLLQRDRICRQR